MISFEEAKKKARELNPQVDNCIEYEDAYVFGVSGDESIGDDPIVILKQNGKAIWMTAYLDLDNGDVAEVKDWGKI